MAQSWRLFVYCRPFLNTTNIVQCAFLGFEPGSAEWKGQTNPLQLWQPLLKQLMYIFQWSTPNLNRSIKLIY